MQTILAEDFFRDAPLFRQFEGVVGARYFAKNPNDPNAVGLWVAESEQTLEIATKVRYRHDSSSRESARADYDFEKVTVKPGDAIIDEHLIFEGSRVGYDFSIPRLTPKGLPSDLYRVERNNGALVQFHIPKAVFKAQFQYDPDRDEYKKKPFPLRLALEPCVIDTGFGINVEISKPSDIWFDGLVVHHEAIKPNPAYLERIIDGKVIDDILIGMHARKGEAFDEGAKFRAAGALSSRNSTLDRLNAVFSYVTQPDMAYMLTDQAKADTRKHLEDIRQRISFFANKHS